VRRLRLPILILLILAVVGYLRVQGTMQALRLSDRQIMRLDRMVAEIRHSRVVFVGEQHDRKESHRAQLAVIRKLHRSGVPLAIGMEMFRAGSQAELDRWVAGEYGLDDFVRFYSSQWNLPWHLYRDILLYARDNRIPLIGLNLPPGISRKVAQKGFAALTPEERRQLPEEVICKVDPGYMSFIRKAYQSHPGNDRSFTHFCEAQMLWNKGMGFHIRQYLGRNPQRTIVVLAGAGHVMKPGIPDEVFKSAGYPYTVILPEPEDQQATSAESDYLILFNCLFRRPFSTGR
jgi:uncharacterized iron-regulated protein